jgi:hypothetical protein
MKTPDQSKKNLTILAPKGKYKESIKQLKQGFKKNISFSAFANLSTNMGSKNE